MPVSIEERNCCSVITNCPRAFGSARVNATFVSNSTLVCVAPFYSGLVHNEMSVQLRVSTNEQDFSTTSASFDFVACPPGAFCSHLQILPCPPGAYCPEGSSSATRMTAPAGYYTTPVAAADDARTGAAPCEAGAYLFRCRR